MSINKKNDKPSSNPTYNYKCLIHRLLNYVPLLNTFRRIKITLNRFFCKSNKNYCSSTYSSSEFKVLPPEHSKIIRFLFMSFCTIVHIEEMYFAKNMTESKPSMLYSGDQ